MDPPEPEKSSAARSLAKRLGFRFLDTGAMYRAVALAAVRKNLDWDDPEALADLARQLQIEVSDDRVLLGGEDVTEAIRTLAITTVTHYAANNAEVREHLVWLQRRAAGSDIVTEGATRGPWSFRGPSARSF